ncbi:MAG: SCO family protein [Bacteroidota bacterium]
MRNLLLLTILFFGCENRSNESLPILGETITNEYTGELIHYKVPSFSFQDQLNQTISNEDFDEKIYVADFFFSSCPTICPKMTMNLKDVQDHFMEEERVGLISFSIDPQNDTPNVLKQYAQKYGISDEKWSLLTGAGTDVFELAKGYKVRAFDDSSPSEFNLIHDGTFVLIDGKRRIRGYYNGLDEGDINRLINDVTILLKSE